MSGIKHAKNQAQLSWEELRGAGKGVMVAAMGFEKQAARGLHSHETTSGLSHREAKAEEKAGEAAGTGEERKFQGRDSSPGGVAVALLPTVMVPAGRRGLVSTVWDLLSLCTSCGGGRRGAGTGGVWMFILLI